LFLTTTPSAFVSTFFLPGFFLGCTPEFRDIFCSLTLLVSSCSFVLAHGVLILLLSRFSSIFLGSVPF
jgi:hypothetical protein